MLLRLGYLTISSVFAVLRLLPMGDRDKDVEILALRHQIAVLERELGQQRVHFTAADRALLSALLHRLPRQAVRRLRLLVRPDTVLRWHRLDEQMRESKKKLAAAVPRVGHQPDGALRP